MSTVSLQYKEFQAITRLCRGLRLDDWDARSLKACLVGLLVSRSPTLAAKIDRLSQQHVAALGDLIKKAQASALR
jgi:hypothetical protein